MAKKRPSKLPSPEDMTFEQATAEVEQIITRIESGEIGLEEALEARRRGDQLLRRCKNILDSAEQELATIAGDEVTESVKAEPPSRTEDRNTDNAG